MKTTIDSAGRIVIPKKLRDELGLSAGVEVEIREYNGVIEIEPLATEFRIVMTGGVPVAVADRPMPTLTDEMVRDTIERVRDERTRRHIDEIRRDRN